MHLSPGLMYELGRYNVHINDLVLPYNGDKEKLKEKWLPNILKTKSDDFWLGFLVNICWMPERYNFDVLVRVLVFDMIKAQFPNKTVHGIGHCRQNSTAIKLLKDKKVFIQRGNDNKRGKQGVTDGAMKMSTPYKFMITMENSRVPGYFTEKLMNGLHAFTIPIYFGDPLVTTRLNNKRFINCAINDTHWKTMQHEMKREWKKDPQKSSEKFLLPKLKEYIGDDLQKCVDRVKEIENNITLYHEILMEPVFYNNTWKHSMWDFDYHGQRIRQILNVSKSYLIHMRR